MGAKSASWWQAIPAEPGVALAIRDHLRPNDVAFDVGAYVGDMSHIMSRVVGPRGLVVAFEANRGVLERLTDNLTSNHLVNVWPIHKAVHAHSRAFATMRAPPGYEIATSIATIGVSGDVETIALDDFVSDSGIVPSLVKLDIEGAEVHALLGFERTIAATRPTFVIEHNVGNDDALRFLRDAGYHTYCCAQHEEIRSSADCFPGSTVRNILCVAEPARMSKVLVHTADHLKIADGFTFADFSVAPGRYILNAELASVESGEVHCEVYVNRALASVYYADGSVFSANCRDVPFDASGTVEYRLYGGALRS
ncbi:MAG: hypothetical protein AUI36_36700, partial [Cyanobacteria bacterium 13_1_40CM_2_61_4]